MLSNTPSPKSTAVCMPSRGAAHLKLILIPCSMDGWLRNWCLFYYGSILYIVYVSCANNNIFLCVAMSVIQRSLQWWKRKNNIKIKIEKWCSPSPLFTAPIALIMPTPDDKEEGNNYLPQYHAPGTCPYFRQAPDLVKAPLPLCLPSH